MSAAGTAVGAPRAWRRSGAAGCRVAERRRARRLRRARGADPDGPAPRAGPVLHARRGRAAGAAGTDERPFLPRAFSVCARRDGAAAVPARGRRPGHRAALRAAAPATGCGSLGPLGIGFSAAAPTAAARCSCGGGVGIAPLAIWQDELLAAGLDGAGAARLPRRRARARARRCSRDAARRHRRRLASATTASSPSCSPPSSTPTPHATVYACGPPPMLEAVRALCAARDVPAQLALEAGMACGFGACFGCVVPTRDGGYLRLCVDGPGARRARDARRTVPVAGARH